MVTQNYAIKEAEILTFIDKKTKEEQEFVKLTVGTTYGKRVIRTFFESDIVLMFKNAIAKNNVTSQEPIPGCSEVITAPKHFRKNRDGVIITDSETKLPVVYDTIGVFFIPDRMETATSVGNRMFRDFVKAGNWEPVTEGPASEGLDPLEKE